jgi:CRISPR-associated protein Cas6/Cse3/CasE, subtype I-E/ECOLI
MYLSRVPLDELKRKTQIAMVSPNKIHGAVEEAFLEKQDRNLWRIDRLGGKTYLLILSAEKPDLSGIAFQFGFADDCGETKEYNRLLERIEKGSVWHFRLAANPVHSIKGGKKRGKVIAHASEKYQLEWLNTQAEKRGFRILPDAVQVMESNWKIFSKGNTNQKVRILEVAFEGMLCVENVDAFRDTLVNGIGREKAYGMGMLTIVRAGV